MSSINDDLMSGGKLQAALLDTDAYGNTVLVGGEGNRIDNLAIGVPPGLNWHTDTISGFDLYQQGFVRTPTIYFDPSRTADSSNGRGTLANPYYTQEHLERLVRNNMAGQILGFKRGTTLRVGQGLYGSASGLILGVTAGTGVYGASGNPFTICPYGDSEQLPIITGGVVQTAWTLVDAGLNIWSLAGFSSEPECWQSDVRLPKYTYSVSPAATLVVEGAATYTSGTLYVRPFNGGNPADGTFETTVVNYAFRVSQATKQASYTGYIDVCGIHACKAIDAALIIYPDNDVATYTATTHGAINIAGCKAGQVGRDAATPGVGCDGIYVSGIPKLGGGVSFGGRIVGNHVYDVMNNGIEVQFTDGLIIENNLGEDCGGNTIAELWSNIANTEVRYNAGYRSGLFPRIYGNFHGSGIWLTNYDNGATYVTTNLCGGNSIHHNYIEDTKSHGIDAHNQVSASTIHHNTIVQRAAGYGYDTVAHTGVVMLRMTGGKLEASAYANNLDVSNNLCVGLAPLVSGNAYCTLAYNELRGYPSGNNNLHYSNDTLTLIAEGDERNNTLTGYKGLAATRSFDQNAKAGPTTRVTGGTWATVEMTSVSALDADGRPGVDFPHPTAGKTGLAYYRYLDGVPSNPSSVCIGAYGGFA